MEKIIEICKVKNKYEVILSSEKKMLLDDETIVRFHLKENLDVSDEDFSLIEKEQSYIETRELALKYIEKKSRAKQEVRAYLEKKGCDTGLIERVLEFMQECRLVDDIGFVERYIKEAINKGMGYEKISYELKKRGVEQNIFDDLREKYFSCENEYERAKEIAEKYIAVEGKTRKAIGRLGRKLYAKGYSEEVIYDVLESYESEDI